MTDGEAKAEAIRRWGANAQAKQNKNGLLDLGMPLEHEMFHLYGWGHTWEEAFALAEERRSIYEHTIYKHTIYKQRHENPPERTAEADQEIAQLRLFP